MSARPLLKTILHLASFEKLILLEHFHQDPPSIDLVPDGPSFYHSLIHSPQPLNTCVLSIWLPRNVGRQKKDRPAKIKNNQVSHTMNEYFDTYIHTYIHTYFLYFDALAQASDIQIERRQVLFLCWMQDLNRGPRQQIASRLNARWQTDWAVEDQAKTWTRQPVPMIIEHSAHLTPLSVDFRTWLWRYTYLLLLISVLWHRLVIFKSKGDKLCSSAECRIWTRGPRHQIASRLNARWQTDWAIEDQAKT